MNSGYLGRAVTQEHSQHHFAAAAVAAAVSHWATESAHSEYTDTCRRETSASLPSSSSSSSGNALKLLTSGESPVASAVELWQYRAVLQQRHPGASYQHYHVASTAGLQPFSSGALPVVCIACIECRSLGGTQSATSCSAKNRYYSLDLQS
eukprot:21324-Heterococcus_DN1.PRE.2